MISDISGVELVSQLAALPLVPQGTNLELTRGENGAGFVQPVANVLQYLDDRRPQPSFEGEERLLITLFEEGQEEVKALNAACLFVKSLTTGRNALSVSAACTRALNLYSGNRYVRRLKPKTFRETYDLWAKQKDWVALVNISKAPATWKPENRGLSEAFLEYCAAKCAQFKRADGKRQAIEAIKKIWRTGRNEYGEAEVIPGYEKKWASRLTELYPDGWHYSNIMRQLNERAKLTKAVAALTREGTAAAKEFLPHNLGTRSALRFMERVTFDDVRTDWLMFDPATGQPCELWLLVARDTATTMVLGFVMHPAHVREDGSNAHLGLKEMKQLAAWLLERYPLPKEYIVHWIVERGTATLSRGSAAALQEMLPNRIQIHFTSMIGGTSPAGYAEKRKGNSRGKASHESHNRLIHTQGSYIPGQTGSHYGNRPADLKARAEECVQTWQLREHLPEHVRGQEKYTLFIPSEARVHLTQIFVDQNFRYDHAIEGFAQVLEWFDGANWRNKSDWDGRAGATWRKRKERPVERAARLIAGHQWEFVSPNIIIAFLKHNARQRPIENDAGEIKTTIDGTEYTFAPASNAIVPAPGTKVLCHFNENDPALLHVTNGGGAVLGTWYRRGRNTGKDEEALNLAFRYTATALKTAQQRAEQLAAPERARLDSIRAHNAELERGNDFIEITDNAQLSTTDSQLSSPVATALATVAPAEQQRAAKEQAAEADYERIAREALQNNHG